MTPVHLDNWAVNTDQYRQSGSIWLSGDASGHPMHEDGKRVATNYIASVDGRLITTKSGTVYRLGRIRRSYRKWLKDNGIPYDSKQPVLIRGDEGLQWSPFCGKVEGDGGGEVAF